MVDARSARFQGMVPGSWGTPTPPPVRRTAMRQTEPPLPAPPQRRTAMRQTEPPRSQPGPVSSNPVSNILNQFGSGLSTALKPTERGMGEFFYPNTYAGIEETGTPRFSDILTDAAGYAIGGAAGYGLGVAGNAAVKAVTNPTNQARLNAIMGRMYHGVQKEDWTTAANRPLYDPVTGDPVRAKNWFDGDLFATSDLPLAESYNYQGIKHIKNLPKDLKVLDLMPGSKPLWEQDPRLAAELMRRYGPDDVASMERHLPYTGGGGDEFKNILEKYGYNALRHISGQGAGGGVTRAKPVYVFFNPEGAVSSPVSPINLSVNRLVQEPSKVVAPIQNYVRQIPDRFADSFQEFLRRQDPELLSPNAQEFLANRGNIIGRGFDRFTRYVSDGNKYVPYRPVDATTNTLSALYSPLFRLRAAQKASRDAYQQRLSEYPQLETANRRAFLESNPDLVGLPRDPTFRFRGGNVPMPPGYQPLPEPAQPGALDFLRYMFAQ